MPMIAMFARALSTASQENVPVLKVTILLSLAPFHRTRFTHPADFEYVTDNVEFRMIEAAWIVIEAPAAECEEGVTTEIAIGSEHSCVVLVQSLINWPSANAGCTELKSRRAERSPVAMEQGMPPITLRRSNSWFAAPVIQRDTHAASGSA